MTRRHETPTIKPPHHPTDNHTMRPQDIHPGQTYIAKIPKTLPTSHPSLLPTAENPLQPLHLSFNRGERFNFAVTAINDDGTVTGARLAQSARAAITLTEEQANLLGLPAGTYAIEGTVTDEDDNPVQRPIQIPLTIPARWLSPLEEPIPIAPSSVLAFRRSVQRKAEGMTIDQIRKSIEEAQEEERSTAEKALDSYKAEERLRVAETRHRELKRIESVMIEAGMERYNGEGDPEKIDDKS
ncbi:hypothetical protein ACFV4P_34300 [Kitasatospora sp. NPDC059795]|uniref:hypothetical protein n=1 Tax=Kitasatospora sp. NPDC059795 TaxID=3346949 RepID=UPI003662E97C